MAILLLDEFTGTGGTNLTGRAPDTTTFNGLSWETNQTGVATATLNGSGAITFGASGTDVAQGNQIGYDPPSIDQTGAFEFSASWVYTSPPTVSAVGTSTVPFSLTLQKYNVSGSQAEPFEAFVLKNTGSNVTLWISRTGTGTTGSASSSSFTLANSTDFSGSLIVGPINFSINFMGQSLSFAHGMALHTLSLIRLAGSRAGLLKSLQVSSDSPAVPGVPKWTNYINTYEVA